MVMTNELAGDVLGFQTEDEEGSRGLVCALPCGRAGSGGLMAAMLAPGLHPTCPVIYTRLNVCKFFLLLF